MIKPLRVLAVDDEALALRRVEIALGHAPNVEIVGLARSGRDGLRMVQTLRPDVVLLDINMPGFSGFDLIDGLGKDHVPLIIFVTAFNEYAVRAFKVSAVDYLLKPLEFDALSEALEKARNTLRLVDADERAVELRDLVQVLRENRTTDEAPRFETEMWVPKGGGFERLWVADLNWVEAERDYVHLHAAGRSYLMRETMGNIQARLDPEVFIRVHRSALVRLDRIASIARPGYGKFQLNLTTGEEVPVGSTYVKQIKRLLSARPSAQQA